jgi:single-strand selective monofunctional uracil DNA glycosylase
MSDVSRQLAEKTRRIKAQPLAAYTYRPLDYARVPHELYLEKFGQGRKRVLLLGMNPGPFGMAQTGVPFGDVGLVRDFLGVVGEVGKPTREHPKRPVEGFACKRSEVSGTRLWGWVKARFHSPDLFFRDYFVANYCPLVFMTESGANLTPDKLPETVRGRIQVVCDEALRAMCDELEPEWVIGVGAFAEKQAARALVGRKERLGTVLHPSPASPKANRGWAAEAERDLAQLGLDFWSKRATKPT